MSKSFQKLKISRENFYFLVQSDEMIKFYSFCIQAVLKALRRETILLKSSINAAIFGYFIFFEYYSRAVENKGIK